jgi:hypothetical protein
MLRLAADCLTLSDQNARWRSVLLALAGGRFKSRLVDLGELTWRPVIGCCAPVFVSTCKFHRYKKHGFLTADVAQKFRTTAQCKTGLSQARAADKSGTSKRKTDRLMEEGP